MLTSVKGIYQNGEIKLEGPPIELPGETPVIVTFLGEQGVDLASCGITPAEASDLRAAFATFDDWNSPQMDVYDDYDAAKANM